MTDLPAEPTFRERLGGRWAISWQAYVITAIPAILVLVVASSRTAMDALGWLFVGLVSVGVVGAWVYLTHRTIFRNRASQPIAVPISILFALLAAVVYVTVSGLLGLLLGLPAESGPWSRVPQTLVIATWWTVALALALEASWRFGRERNALIERAVQQQLASMQEAEVAERLRQSIHESVSDQLSESRLRVERHLEEISDASHQSLTAVATELRDTAKGTVRPLSHSLAEGTSRAYRKPGLFAVLSNIVNRQPFRPVIVSVIYVVTTAPREIERLGWQGGIMWVAITVALIAITMTVANLAMKRWPQHHAALFIGGIVLIESPSFALANLYANLTGIELTMGQVVVQALLGSLLIIATSGFGSWRATRRDLLRTFATDLKDEEIETIARSRALAAAAREAAGVLHGPVQTKLVACAMAIDHAAAAGDVIAVNQALVQARAVLERPVPDLAPDRQTTIAAEVERKAELWRGLVTIMADVDPSIAALDGSVAVDVGAVVEEGIANSIQHGAATEITISITPQQGDIVIRLTDNGAGPTLGPSGLGSQLLDRLAPGWRLEAEPAGARLVATIPRKPSAAPPVDQRSGLASTLTTFDLSRPAVK